MVISVDEVGVMWLDWVVEVRWLLLLEGYQMEEHLAFLGSLCLCVRKSSSTIPYLYHGDKLVR